jgi:hypothetical protein
MNHELISRLYKESVAHCVKLGPNPNGTNRAWAWEEKFAELIVEHCAKIAEDCYVYHEPLSKVPGHIRNFERLTDENMSTPKPKRCVCAI